MLLEKKLEKLSDLLEQREAQISEVLAAAQLDPAAVVSVNKKLEVCIKRNLIMIISELGMKVHGSNIQYFPAGYAQ